MNKIILSIELVPSSSWLNNVRNILSQTQWDIIKNIVYSKAYYICEICGGVGPKHPVECHEIWKYNDKKLTQHLEGMVALCPNCHMVKHIGLARIRGDEDKAIAHLMKVNNWTYKKSIKYIQKCFDIWRKRSSKKWKLSISHLKEYGIDIEK